ncbi:hypothetical protein wTpre_501 [Wolbachia endosymbiont of Trichogramma pretiosum]|nr:hypothetical protein wTpre_501 [Wolbachia endosymbiont of Trichogramma pretiosum]
MLNIIADFASNIKVSSTGMITSVSAIVLSILFCYSAEQILVLYTSLR